MAHTDLRRGTWIDRYLPASWRPAARLARWDRPIGTWLLGLPGAWAILLAAATQDAHTGWGVTHPLALLVLFAVGAIAMRGAGCTINDLWDRDLDAGVERTAGRPLPAGAISVRGALAFLAGQLAVGAVVLGLLHPWAILLGVASLVLVVLYPLAKRVTWWPQAVLGLTFNFSALVGWAAVAGGLSWAAGLLYLGGLAWTLGYDTIYAHQDKADDAIMGVKSSARWLGRWSRPFVLAIYLVAAVLWIGAGSAAGAPDLYYLGPVLAFLHLYRQASRTDFDDPAQCLASFKSNRTAGLLMALGPVLAALLS